jgi:hypothetical protein
MLVTLLLNAMPENLPPKTALRNASVLATCLDRACTGTSCYNRQPGTRAHAIALHAGPSDVFPLLCSASVVSARVPRASGVCSVAHMECTNDCPVGPRRR